MFTHEMTDDLCDIQGEFYEKLCSDVMSRTTSEQRSPVFGYEYCELEPDMLGFLENYADLEKLPKDFVIIDLGCNQAMQGTFFQDHKRYIGIDPAVPTENRFRSPNASYAQCSIKEFIDTKLPPMLDKGMDLNKTFVICSGVPDFKETDLIPDIFPNYRIAYPGELTKAKYPQGFQPYANYPEKLAEHFLKNHENNDSENKYNILAAGYGHGINIYDHKLTGRVDDIPSL